MKETYKNSVGEVLVGEVFLVEHTDNGIIFHGKLDPTYLKWCSKNNVPPLTLVVPKYQPEVKSKWQSLYIRIRRLLSRS